MSHPFRGLTGIRRATVFGAFLLAASTATAQTDPDEDAALRLATQLQTAFERVAEKVFPSVVSITTFTEDVDWTYERLENRKGRAWVESNREELLYPGFRRTRAGSGVVVSQDGYILSCHDNVLDASGEIARVIDVELAGDHHVLARVAGSEPTINLSVLKIDVPPDHPSIRLMPAKIGDSDAVRVGHWAIALGDPQGAERTYAAGILSAQPQRQCYQQELTRTLLQTSLSLHPESCGGPLVDIRGEVFGINVPRPGVEGLESPPQGSGYALPINLVNGIFEALKAKGSTRSPWLGVSVLEMRTLRERLLTKGETMALPESVYYPGTGVYIDNVFDPSPASRAGIRVGDFLVKLDGNFLFSPLDFQKWLYLAGIGKTVKVELFRDGESLEKTVAIEARPASATTR